MAPLGLGRSVMVGWHTPCVSTPTGISPVLVTTQIDELTDPTLPSPPPTMESQDTLRVARTVDPWPAEVMSGSYDSLGRCVIASALEEKQSGFGSIDPVVPPGTRWCKPMLAQLPWARCAESECAWARLLIAVVSLAGPAQKQRLDLRSERDMSAHLCSLAAPRTIPYQLLAQRPKMTNQEFKT